MNFAKYVYGYFTNIFYAIFRTEYFYATLSLFFVIFNVYIYIMKLTWIQALKKWNESNDGSWCVPRKGSQGYDVVKAIMTGEEKKEKKEKPKKTKKTKQEKQKKKEQAKELSNNFSQVDNVNFKRGVEMTKKAIEAGQKSNSVSFKNADDAFSQFLRVKDEIAPQRRR